jgi:hypothetical protein
MQCGSCLLATCYKPEPCAKPAGARITGCLGASNSDRQIAPYGRLLYKRVFYRCAPYRRVPHERVPHERVPHERVPYRRAPNGRVPYGRVPYPIHRQRMLYISVNRYAHNFVGILKYTQQPS